jgi:dihydrofolate synthase/folylpolyglutamate synthase
LSSSSGTENYWAEQARQVELELLARNPENKPRPRLEPTRRAVELLGDPQSAYRVIHITGTNGKTSTARMIERLLRETGLRTGRFTSPHLVSFNERISIDGEPVDNELLVEVWRSIEPILNIVDSQLEAEGESTLTYFEALAVLGFAVFADAPVDVLVLEVGMGGEWDSTNVANGDVAVFTPIALDHTDRIGRNITEIAQTKAGIMKSGTIVVSAEQSSEAKAVLAARAAELDLRVFNYGTNFEVLDSEANKVGQTLSIRSIAGSYHDLQLPLHGYFQAENSALALAAVEAFLGGGELRIIDDIVRVALADATSPGRLQVIEFDPIVVIDGAHNPHGAAAIADALESSFGAPQVFAVVSMVDQKDAEGFLAGLASQVDHFIFTKSNSERAIEAERLAERAHGIVDSSKITIQGNLSSAIEQAKKMARDSGEAIVLATGSLTLVGELLSMKQKEAELDA